MLENVQDTKVIGITDTGNKGTTLRKILLFMLGVGAAAVTGFALEFSFRHASLYLGVLIAAWILWAGIYLVSSLVLPASLAVAKTLLEVTLMTVPFVLRLTSWWGWAIWGAAVLCAGFSYVRASHTLENVLKLRMGTVFLAARPSLVVILSLLCAAAYMAIRFPSASSFVTERDVQGVLEGVDPVMRIIYPGFDSTRTVNAMLDPIVQKVYSSTPADVIKQNIPLPSGVSLPQGLNVPLVEQWLAGAKANAKQQLLTQLGALFGRRLTGTETFSNIVYQWLADAYAKIPAQTRVVVHDAGAAVAFLAFYLTFQFFGFAFDALFGAVYGALKALRMVKIGTVTVEKETLTI